MEGVEKMRVNPITSRHKKRVIKWENVTIAWYVIITLFKYFITLNQDILTLLYDLSIDTLVALFLYHTILILRKEPIR